MTRRHYVLITLAVLPVAGALVVGTQQPADDTLPARFIAVAGNGEMG